MIPTEVEGFLLLLFFHTPSTRKNPIKPDDYTVNEYGNNPTGMAPKKLYITTDLFCYLLKSGTDTDATGVKFGDWTDKKSRKEKRRERKARERNDSKPNPEPELLFYGRNSGVPGLSKSELFRPIKDDEPCTSGYDKVCKRAF